MQLINLFPPIFLSLLWMALPAVGAPKMRGPLPQEQRDLIHFMAEHHDEIERKVTLTDKGYRALTTSKNAEVVAALKTHVAYMKKRLDSGAMVRRWDPAFAEMVDYWDQLESTIEIKENGVEVTVTGKNEDAVKVARNHARIVSGFAQEGFEALQREHETALGKKENE